MKKTTRRISLAGSQLGEVRHVCAFFNNAEEEYRVLLPFIKDGFECGDKAVHVVNPDQRHDHLQRLAAVGIDPAAAEQSGQFEVRINTEAYIRDGRFDQDRMLAAFEQMASGNAKGGFPLSRICCRMDWAIEDRSYIDDLVEFESRVNDVWRRHDDAVICTYHLGKFGGDTVVDIMRTHPMIIIGGILHEIRSLCRPRSFCPSFANGGLCGLPHPPRLPNMEVQSEQARRRGQAPSTVHQRSCQPACSSRDLEWQRSISNPSYVARCAHAHAAPGHGLRAAKESSRRGAC